MATSKKKKKKLLTLIILFILFVGIIVLAVILSKNSKNKNQNENESQAVNESLFDDEYSSITKLTIYTDGVKASFERKSADDKWCFADENKGDVLQSKVNVLINAILSVKSQGKYADSLENANDFGINDKSTWAELETSGGKTLKLTYGIKLPSSPSYYYATVGGENTVIAVGNASRELISADIKSYIELPAFPAMTGELLTEITYEDDNQSITLYNDPADLSLSDAIGTTTWYYRLYDRYIAANYDEITDLITKITGIKYTDCVSYEATEAELEEYGLKSPSGKLTIKGKTDAESGETFSYIIAIGNKTGDGEYYLLLEGDDNIYTCSSENVAVLTDNYLPDYLMSRYPALCNFDGIKAINVKTADKQMLIEVEQSKGTGEDGEEITIYDCKLNGEKYDEKEIRGIYADLIRITADHILKDGEEKPADEPVFTCSYTTSYEDRPVITYEIYNYDSTYYQLSLDGHMKYIISKQDYNTLISNISKGLV